MANENLGANFSIDVTDLKAGLAQANRLIRESESEFRAAAAGMDDWSESQEGLTKRVDSLSTQVDIQKKKVAALISEKERIIQQMTEEGKSNEEIERAIDGVNKKITQESKQLDRLKGDLDKSEKALDEFGDSSEDAGKGLEGLSKVGGLAGKAIAAVGAAAGAAVTGFFALAESTREYRQDMAQLAQNAGDAGVSLDDMKDKLIEVGAVTGDADAALEGMNMLMATGLDTSQIEQAADALTGAATKFDGLKFEGMAEGLQETLATGVAVGPFAELIERTGGDLEAFNAGLANCTTEAERQAYAMQFLTESGLMEANAAYKETNADLIAAAEAEAKMTDAMAELGAIAEPIMTTLKTLATDLLVSITPFVQLIGEGLGGALEGSAGAADTLAQGLTGIIQTLISQVITMLPFIIDTIVAIVPQLITALLEQVPSITRMLLNVTESIILALSEVLPQILTQIMELVPLLIELLIAAVPMLLEAATTLLMAIVDALPTIIASLISALPSVIQTIIDALIESIPILLEAAITLLMALVEAIPTIIDALIEALPQIIQTIIDGLISALPQVLNGAITLLMAIIKAIPTIVQSLAGALPQIINTVTSTLLNNLPLLLSTAVTLFMAIIEAIPQIVTELAGNIPTIITAIVDGLSAGVSEVFNVGVDLISGLWNGISSMTDWVIGKIQGFGESVLGGLKSFFGIASPSKVMADQVGKNLALGIEEGFEDNIGAVNKAITKSMSFDAPSVNVDAINASGGLASRPQGVVVYQTNNYSQAHSRYEIYQSQRQTAAAVRLAMGGAY